MKEQLSKILNKENISYAKFADIIDVQRSSISHILSGRNKPSFDFVQKIVTHFPKINAEWLITGKGEMYKSKMKEIDLFSGEKQIKPDTEGKKSTQQPENHLNKEVYKEVTNVNNIQRIVIFYTDNSFEEFKPR